MMGVEEPLVELRDVGCLRKCDLQPVLRDVSLQCRRGEFIGLVGPSGCGKTAMLTVLLNHWQGPTSGYTRVNASSFGFVPSSPLLTVGLTIRETLDFTATLRLPKMRAAQRKERVAYAIDAMCLNGNMRITRTTERSVTRRVAVAAELLSEIDLLILDEPATGLDSKHAAEMMAMLEQLAVQRGLTVIVSVHQPRTSVFLMFTRVVLMAAGRVLFTGPPRNVMEYLVDALGGVEKPPVWSVAEFALEVALAASQQKTEPNVDFSIANKMINMQSVHARAAELGVDALANRFKARDAAQNKESVLDGGEKKQNLLRRNPYVGWVHQCSALAKRQLLSRYRDPVGFIVLLVLCILQAFLISAVFWQMPDYVDGLRPIQILDIVQMTVPSFLTNGTLQPWLSNYDSPLFRLLDRGIDGRGDSLVQDLFSPEPNAYWGKPLVNLALDTLDGLHAGWNVTAAWQYPPTAWELATVVVNEGGRQHRWSKQNPNGQWVPEAFINTTSGGGFLTQIVVEQEEIFVKEEAPVEAAQKIEVPLPLQVLNENGGITKEEWIAGMGRGLRALHMGDMLWNHYDWGNVTFCPGYIGTDRLVTDGAYWLCNIIQMKNLIYPAVTTLGFGYSSLDEILSLLARLEDRNSWISNDWVPRPPGWTSAATAEYPRTSLERAVVGSVKSPAWWWQRQWPRRKRELSYEAPTVDGVINWFWELDPVTAREELANSGWSQVVEQHVGLEALDLLPALQQYASIITERGVECKDPLCSSLRPFADDLGDALRLLIEWFVDGYVSSSTMFNICGVIFFVSLFVGFTAYDVVLTFPRDRKIFNREESAGMYSSSAYYIGRQLGDLPFQILPAALLASILYFGVGLHRIGNADFGQFAAYFGITLLTSSAAYGFGYAVSSVSETLQTAVIIAPIFLMAWLCVAGFFLRDSDVGPWVAWLKYISFYRWGFFGQLSVIFADGKNFGSLSNEFAKALAGVTEDRIWVNCVMLAVVNLGYRILGFFGLKYCFRSIGVES